MEIKTGKKAILLGRFFLFIFSFIFLGVYNREYLYKLQNASYFVFSDSLMEELMGQTGGVLVYVSAFLTQFLYYPLLGAAMLVLLLLLFERVVVRLTGSVVFSFSLAGLALLTLTSLGYALYDILQGTFPFLHLLGLLSASLLALGYKRFSGSVCGSYLFIAASALSFFLIGAYAYIALLFIVVFSLFVRVDGMAVKALLCLSSVPLLPYCTSHFLFHEIYSLAFFAPFPSPYFLNLFIFSMVTVVLLSFSPLFSDRIQVLAGRLDQKWMPSAAVALLCAVVFFASCRDSNFRTELKMQRLAEAHRWDELLEVADGVSHPTNTIFAYRAIALSCKNRLSRKLFDYPCDFKRVKTNYLPNQPRYFEDVFLYASFINNAYLWSMEFWCNIGYSYEHLKKMTVCALLNDEPSLAYKYIQVLKRTLFQRGWALEYEEYVGHPERLFAKYPEFAEVKANIPTQEIICQLDPIRKTYAGYTFLSNKNAERRLLTDLYNKDMKVFLRDALQSRALYAKREAPDCVKEALVICALQQGDPSLLKGFRVSKKTIAEVERIYNVAKTSKSTEEAAASLAGLRDNYCYFYLFSNN